MKPLAEQQWKVHGPLNNAGQIAVTSDDGRMVASTRALDGEAVAAFIAAAPAMARALLAHGRFAEEPSGDREVWHTHACWGTGRAMCTPDCERDRDALRLAGVLTDGVL